MRTLGFRVDNETAEGGLVEHYDESKKAAGILGELGSPPPSYALL